MKFVSQELYESAAFRRPRSVREAGMSEDGLRFFAVQFRFGLREVEDPPAAAGFHREMLQVGIDGFHHIIKIPQGDLFFIEFRPDNKFFEPFCCAVRAMSLAFPIIIAANINKPLAGDGPSRFDQPFSQLCHGLPLIPINENPVDSTPQGHFQTGHSVMQGQMNQQRMRGTACFRFRRAINSDEQEDSLLPSSNTEWSMSLEFKTDWNKEKASYAATYGSYQDFLDSVTETDVKTAINRAATFWFDDQINSVLKQAMNAGGERVVVEQGSHQVENPKDAAGGFTLHITLRHYPPAIRNRAFHAYLAQHADGSYYFTTFTYFQSGAGLKTVQTGGRAFMEGLQKQFLRAHGGSDSA